MDDATPRPPVPDEDGWYTMPDGKKTSRVCPVCQSPYIPRNRTQLRCGSEACRGRVRYLATKDDPKRRENVRKASRKYAQRKRAVAGKPDPAPRATPAPAAPPDPWAAPSPPAALHLLGAWRELVFDPAPRVPLPHSQALTVHGIVSHAVGRDHDRTRADFVLAQARVPSGWGVYFVDGADARRMSCAPMPGLHLDGRPWRICFGPGVVVPKVLPVAPGRYAVRLTTLTPVVIRRTVDGKTLVRVAPTAASIRASLTGLEFLLRAGLATTTPPAWVGDLCVVMGRHDTRRQSLDTHGHWHTSDETGHGRVVGWQGDVDLVVNAVGLYLLRVAEVVGLGGRVAVGFGQVRVTPGQAASETPRRHGLGYQPCQRHQTTTTPPASLATSPRRRPTPGSAWSSRRSTTMAAAPSALQKTTPWLPTRCRRPRRGSVARRPTPGTTRTMRRTAPPDSTTSDALTCWARCAPSTWRCTSTAARRPGSAHEHVSPSPDRLGLPRGPRPR